MYNIIKTSKFWFVFSGILTVISIIFLSLGGLKLGIDFTGGALLELKFEKERPETIKIQESLRNLDLGEILIQPVGQQDVTIRMKDINNETRQKVLDNLSKDYGSVSEISFETVGPTVGKELQQRSLVGIILVMLAIILYISWAFRKVSIGPVPSYIYGAAAVIALIHDLFVVLGTFAILGYFLKIEVGTQFVTALLTVLGFSVHDTIVVFDRIRETLWKSHEHTFREMINEAINATMIRSINTSLTALFVLIALYLFGGESIKYFVLALIIGIITGTYSSIFIASPLLLVWQKVKARR